MTSRFTYKFGCQSSSSVLAVDIGERSIVDSKLRSRNDRIDLSSQGTGIVAEEKIDWLLTEETPSVPVLKCSRPIRQ